MCEHSKFNAEVKTVRLTDDDGKITGYTTDITISCAECFKPFRWVGVPMGYSVNQPMVSIDGLELRAPIEPVV